MKKNVLLLMALLGNCVMSHAQSALFYTHAQMGDIRCVLRTSNDSVLVAMENGLALFTNYGNNYSLINNQSSFVIKKNDNDIWVGQDAQILKITGSNITTYNSSNGLPLNSATTDFAFTAGEDNVWAVVSGQLYRLVNNQFTNENRAATTLASNQNKLYIGTFDFAQPGFEFDGTTWTTLPSLTLSVADNRILFIALGNDGSLWAKNHLGKIFRYSGNTWSLIAEGWGITTPMAVHGNDAYVIQSTRLVKISPTAALDTFRYPTYSMKPNFNSNFGSKLSTVNGAFYYGEKSKDVFSAIEFFPDVHTQSQASVSLVPNNFSSTFSPTGDLFIDYSKDNLFAMLQYQGKPASFLGQLWFSGTVGNDTKVAHTLYRQTGGDFYSGPISNQYDKDYLEKYNHVWKVTRAQIETHKQNFGNANYTPPFDILTWPGNGNTQKGEAEFLAPFIDVDFDGIYDPLKGDYPDIRGNEAAFCIFNDDRGPKYNSEGKNIGIEVHLMVFGYDSLQVPESKNALFYSYKIINRSGGNINNARIGFFNDLGLGGFNSPSGFATDSTHKASVSYKMSLSDPGNTGFGQNPPALATAFLNHNMNGVSFFFNNPGTIGNPNTPDDVLNYMSFNDRAGSPLVAECFNGNPFTSMWPYNYAAGCLMNPMFNQDIRLIHLINVGNLSNNQEFCLDAVMIMGRDSVNTNQSIYASLEQSLLSLQNILQFYNDLNLECLGKYTSVNELPTYNKHRVKIYPNPAQSQINLELGVDHLYKTVEIFDLMGRKVLEVSLDKDPQNQIDVSKLKAGSYTLKLLGSKHPEAHKILITK